MVLQCPKCDKTFVDDKVLIEHIKLVHGDKEPKSKADLRRANNVALSQIQSNDPRNRKNKKSYHVCNLDIPPTGLKLARIIN